MTAPIEHQQTAPSDEGVLIPSRVVWTGYRVIFVVCAGLGGLMVPIVLRDGLPYKPPEIPEGMAAIEGSWVANLLLGIFAWPLLFALWNGLARLLRIRLLWSPPAWSRSPVDFSRPLEVLHLVLWATGANCAEMLFALPVASDWFLSRAVPMQFGSFVSLWVCMRFLATAYRIRGAQ